MNIPAFNKIPPVYKLFLGAIGIAFAPILVKAVNVPPAMTGVYRCGIASILLTPFFFVAWRRRTDKQSIPVRGWVFLLLAGLFFALDLHAWHKSIGYIGAGLATILANTQVLYSAVFGMIFWRERPALRFWLAVPVAFLGIFMLIHFHGGVEEPELYLYGITLGIMAGALYALYILSLRQAESIIGTMNTMQKVTIICYMATAVMFILAWEEGVIMLPTLRDFGFLFLLAVVAQIGGWILISNNLPHIPIAIAGLVLLSQPVMATVMGAMIYNERLTALQILGAVLTLAALYWGGASQKNNKPDTLQQTSTP